MLKLSLPAILGMIVIGLYPLMDGIFAGSFLRSLARAASFWLSGEAFAEPILRLFGLSDQTLVLAVPSFRIMYSIFIAYGVMIMLMTFFRRLETENSRYSGDVKADRLLYPGCSSSAASAWRSEPLVRFADC